MKRGSSRAWLQAQTRDVRRLLVFFLVYRSLKHELLFLRLEGWGRLVPAGSNRVRFFQDHQLRDSSSCPGQSQGKWLRSTHQAATTVDGRCARLDEQTEGLVSHEILKIA